MFSFSNKQKHSTVEEHTRPPKDERPKQVKEEYDDFFDNKGMSSAGGGYFVIAIAIVFAVIIARCNGHV